MSSQDQEKEKKPKPTKQRMRFRNWVGTQWIETLERGGGEKAKKKDLDPRSTEWFEDRLETLAMSTQCRYLVYQIEKTEAESAHYQIYIEFNEQVDKMSVLAWLHRTTYLDQRRGARKSARHYAQKGNCGKRDCSHKWERHGDKPCHLFESEIVQTYREFGVWHASGQRVDIETLLMKLDEHTSWLEVVRDDEISLELAKYMRFAKEYFDAKKPPELELKLNTWQQSMLEELEEEPDDRSIVWIYDPLGGIGNSTLAKYLVRNHDAIIVSGSKNDILHGYQNQKIVIFDYTRSQEGYISYSAMEDIKNGCYFVSKYNSRMVVRDGNCHVLVFANWVPDESKLSQDRWDIRVMSSRQ